MMGLGFGFVEVGELWRILLMSSSCRGKQPCSGYRNVSCAPSSPHRFYHAQAAARQSKAAGFSHPRAQV